MKGSKNEKSLIILFNVNNASNVNNVNFLIKSAINTFLVAEYYCKLHYSIFPYYNIVGVLIFPKKWDISVKEKSKQLFVSSVIFRALQG